MAACCQLPAARYRKRTDTVRAEKITRRHQGKEERSGREEWDDIAQKGAHDDVAEQCVLCNSHLHVEEVLPIVFNDEPCIDASELHDGLADSQEHLRALGEHAGVEAGCAEPRGILCAEVRVSLLENHRLEFALDIPHVVLHCGFQFVDGEVLEFRESREDVEVTIDCVGDAGFYIHMCGC